MIQWRMLFFSRINSLCLVFLPIALRLVLIAVRCDYSTRTWKHTDEGSDIRLVMSFVRYLRIMGIERIRVVDSL